MTLSPSLVTRLTATAEGCTLLRVLPSDCRMLAAV